MRDAGVGTARLPRCARGGVLVVLAALVGVLATSAQDSTFNPDDPAYLRRQYAWFQAQDPPRQHQLRKLHADLTGLPPEEQGRLIRVMQAYNAWLARLPAEDRERILNAPTPTERLEMIRDYREREWVRSLPKPYREEYAGLDEPLRHQWVKDWRAKEAERREEWDLAQRHWAGNPAGRLPMVMQGDGRSQFETFVGHLKENLLEPERRLLDEARQQADEYGHLFGYVLEVVKLADRHPILPGRPGPKDFDSMPQAVQGALLQQEPTLANLRKRRPVPGGDDLRELRKSQGRWPEFAIELTRYAQRKGLSLPEPLGDCRKEQMPPEVIELMTRTLEPRLRATPEGRADLRLLEAAQGKWPEYPRQLVDLARKHKLAVPGWTLPGSPAAWDVFRAGRNRAK